MAIEKLHTYTPRPGKLADIPLPDSLSTLYQQSHTDHIMNTHTQTTLCASVPDTTHFSFVDILFSRLIDAVIFTSAVAITAYNYWTGSMALFKPIPYTDNSSRRLDQKPNGLDIGSRRQPHTLLKGPLSPTMSQPYHEDPLYDIRRRRTEEWTDQIIQQQQQAHRSREHSKQRCLLDQSQVKQKLHHRSASAFSYSKSNIVKSPEPTSIMPGGTGEAKLLSKHERSKKRSKSFDFPKYQAQQDAMLSRMQLQLQNLIKEGQAALTTPADIDDEQDFSYDRKGYYERNKKLERLYTA